ncbi:MAG: DNA translocase FtsK 4TM domain-containing protein [Thermodesulfobacteriota bacterium]|nr:DNA translocase FtsK 4TM domain-containing protein [Thermodesulfobacteriota bacterium]
MKKEILSIFFLFLFVLTLVSLLSNDPSDPTVMSHTSPLSGPIENTLGLAGAYYSGVLIFFFGLGAFWIPPFFLLCARWAVKRISSSVLMLTLTGFFLIIVSTGSLLAVGHHEYSLLGRTCGAGGLLGSFLADFLVTYSKPAGAFIILLFFFVLGFVMATGITLSAFLLLLKRMVSLFFLWVLKLVKCLYSFVKNCLVHVKTTYQHHWAGTPSALIEKIQRKKNHDFQTRELLSAPVDTQENPPPSSPSNKRDLVIRKAGKKKSLSDVTADIEDVREDKKASLPPVSLLRDVTKNTAGVDRDVLRKKGEILEKKLNDFGITGEVAAILPGPVITTFEYRPAPGIKISKIVNLTDDLALALRALSIRIVAPIPGKDVVGVEIPNDVKNIVTLKELLVSSEFKSSTSKLTLGLGKDIFGIPVAAQLDTMPHLLIAGATGTGKSVGLNAMISSILYKAGPEEVKFIMVDPKRIELSVYDGIPHLISPVVTDMKKATNALFWAVREMERRYELLAQNSMRNLRQFNAMVARKQKNRQEKRDDPVEGEGDQQNHQSSDQEAVLEKLPYLVVIVDELADLMMVASRDVESALTRLAQMARAAGIHMILATQRPSVDVLTGVIKANFPTRISFQVSSRTDSRTILDANGSERLLGNGDMLFLPPGTGRLQRIQCAYITEEEISRITGFLKAQQPPAYIEDITEKPDEKEAAPDKSEYDEKYDEAVALVTRTRQASISSVQRHLRIGYNRAARIIEIMEKEGVIGPQEGAKQREVLAKSYDD